MRLIVDSSVTDEVEISIGSGIRNTTIILRQKDLLRGLPQAEIGAFTE
jgi:prolyl-tRNA editing enzyme YbaK/EbsC (Cys-tRNA(Pro) deacylase)